MNFNTPSLKFRKKNKYQLNMLRKNEVLEKIFEIINDNDLKLTVYGTVTIFHHRVLDYFKNIENSDNKSVLELKKDDLDKPLYLMALLSLACKVNEFEMPSKIIHKYLEKNNLNTPISDNECEFNKFKRKKDSLEATIASLFDFKLHSPCPFIRILGFLILLNEHGKLIFDNRSRVDKNSYKSSVEYLFKISVQNLKRILLDEENILDYHVNELAMAAIPKDTLLFKDLTLGDDIDSVRVCGIRERHSIYVNEL